MMRASSLCLFLAMMTVAAAAEGGGEDDHGGHLHRKRLDYR